MSLAHFEIPVRLPDNHSAAITLFTYENRKLRCGTQWSIEGKIYRHDGQHARCIRRTKELVGKSAFTAETLQAAINDLRKLAADFRRQHAAWSATSWERFDYLTSLSKRELAEIVITLAALCSDADSIEEALEGNAAMERVKQEVEALRNAGLI